MDMQEYTNKIKELNKRIIIEKLKLHLLKKRQKIETSPVYLDGIEATIRFIEKLKI